MAVKTGMVSYFAGKNEPVDIDGDCQAGRGAVRVTLPGIGRSLMWATLEEAVAALEDTVETYLEYMWDTGREKEILRPVSIINSSC